jgi:hypothetical protein
MFSPINCDITKAVKPGRNVIAAHVISNLITSNELPNKVEGVAVTVEITSSMLHSLPHGMFQEDVSGIWQPVKLTITAPTYIHGCVINTSLDGARVSLDVRNGKAKRASLGITYEITSANDGSVLYSNISQGLTGVPPSTDKNFKLITPRLSPKLWSPQNPNLYNLDVRLFEGGKVVDSYRTRFGFRTFAVDGSRLLLNGKPIWLRGANPFPNALRPNDAELAHRFIQTARAGNVLATRTHISPFTTTWLDAADECGMAVSVEGTWPWLMLEGEPPDEQLLKIWKDEFVSLIREYQNHPSIVMWTVNNEMKFQRFDEDKPVLLKKKWLILQDAIKAIRSTDPTRPVVADSSYVRKEAKKSYETIVQPGNIDDGDIDDLHRYYGWYNETFFHYYNDAYGFHFSTPDRPLISQEMSTGYPNNEDGHPVRSYLFNNCTPQALVGDDAYENADPSIFLKRQSFMTKELTEALRRTSHESSAGLLLFSYLTWFQKPWSVNQIEPGPTYYGLQTALQPVLVSAELFGRHFYAGSTLRRRVCIVNDSDNYQSVPAGRLNWEFKSNGKTLGQGTIQTPEIGYYDIHWLDADFVVPGDLPTSRTDAQLVLKLQSDGKPISENTYDVTLTTTNWTNGKFCQNDGTILWDPGRDTSEELSGLRSISTIGGVATTNVLVVGRLSDYRLTENQIRDLRDFVSGGGRMLMLHPGAALTNLFPDQVIGFVPKKAEIVAMHIPESTVFDGIEPLDLAWFESRNRQIPLAATGVYQISPQHDGVLALASQCDFHGYLAKPTDIVKISGTPLLEIQIGKGRLLASEMCLEEGKNDPIAKRLLMNCLSYLQTK